RSRRVLGAYDAACYPHRRTRLPSTSSPARYPCTLRTYFLLVAETGAVTASCRMTVRTDVLRRYVESARQFLVGCFVSSCAESFRIALAGLVRHSLFWRIHRLLRLWPTAPTHRSVRTLRRH